MNIANDLITKKDFSHTIVCIGHSYSGQYFMSMNKRKSKKTTFYYKNYIKLQRNRLDGYVFFYKKTGRFQACIIRFPIKIILRERFFLIRSVHRQLCPSVYHSTSSHNL